MTTIALLQAVHSASADMVHKKLLQRTKVRECSEMFASFHPSTGDFTSRYIKISHRNSEITLYSILWSFPLINRWSFNKDSNAIIIIITGIMQTHTCILKTQKASHMAHKYAGNAVQKLITKRKCKNANEHTY